MNVNTGGPRKGKVAQGLRNERMQVSTIIIIICGVGLSP
jgi:hypothetical protein